MSNVGEIPGVEFLDTAPKFRKRKKHSSSCVYASSIKRPIRTLGKISNDDGDGSENVTIKINSRFTNVVAIIPTCFKSCQMQV